MDRWPVTAVSAANARCQGPVKVSSSCCKAQPLGSLLKTLLVGKGSFLGESKAIRSETRTCGCKHVDPWCRPVCLWEVSRPRRIFDMCRSCANWLLYAPRYRHGAGKLWGLLKLFRVS